MIDNDDLEKIFWLGSFFFIIKNLKMTGETTAV